MVAKFARTPVKDVPPSAVPVAFVEFGPLVLEARAAYRGIEKGIFSFDEAQADLAARRLVLPSLRDVMLHVIIPGLEGTLSPVQQQCYEDLLTGYGEWTDNIFYRDGNALYIGTGVRGLIWNGTRYDATTAEVRSFSVAYDITRLISQDLVPLELVAKHAPALVMATYGRPYNRLPRRLQKEEGLILPADGAIRPVGLADQRPLVGCGWDHSAFRGARCAKSVSVHAPAQTSSRSPLP